MKRFNDLQLFYELLQQLEEKIGRHYLAECSNRMEWPYQGVYFFFEPGEYRDNGTELRVVRIGVSNPPRDKQSGLWDRLRQNRGTVAGKLSGGGDHRISDFRTYVGSALARRDNIICPTWEEAPRSNASIREAEHHLEARVTEVICGMPFLWISTDSSKNPSMARQVIKNNAIALLSNYQKPARDKASEGWLGSYCQNRLVRLSGLWHSDHVGDNYDPIFINLMKKLIKATCAGIGSILALEGWGQLFLTLITGVG
ncbi:hypothetical protein [Syntrophomonas palmitatica]|uniref:hypothetical protein n=1 Tax=Syntrophomonas palmitatica TaxID=402877 RepID=UPI0006D27C56|nr:hypothetical protein [Syntrophomonas palmitatica]